MCRFQFQSKMLPGRMIAISLYIVVILGHHYGAAMVSKRVLNFGSGTIMGGSSGLKKVSRPQIGADPQK